MFIYFPSDTDVLHAEHLAEHLAPRYLTSAELQESMKVKAQQEGIQFYV